MKYGKCLYNAKLSILSIIAVHLSYALLFILMHIESQERLHEFFAVMLFLVFLIFIINQLIPCVLIGRKQTTLSIFAQYAYFSMIIILIGFKILFPFHCLLFLCFILIVYLEILDIDFQVLFSTLSIISLTVALVVTGICCYIQYIQHIDRYSIMSVTEDVNYIIKKEDDLSDGHIRLSMARMSEKQTITSNLSMSMPIPRERPLSTSEIKDGKIQRIKSLSMNLKSKHFKSLSEARSLSYGTLNDNISNVHSIPLRIERKEEYRELKLHEIDVLLFISTNKGIAIFMNALEEEQMWMLTVMFFLDLYGNVYLFVCLYIFVNSF